MKAPRFTLVTDGPTDGDMLVPILEWLLRTRCPSLSVKVEYADTRGRMVSKGLHQKIAFALENYPCECLFIHRDAEKEPADNRRDEIRNAIESLGAKKPAAHLCVVPIRMSEAWLLIDEPAIRRAAGNPNGRIRLEMPRRSAIEGLPDPKRLLHELLVTASELNGRRRKSFESKTNPHLVARFIDDFSRLRELAAFQALESDIQQIVREKRWNATG